MLTPRDLVEVYELRSAMRSRRAQPGSPARGPEEARRALAAQRRLTGDSARRDLVEADLAFHRAIVDGAGNGRLSAVHRDIAAEIRLSLAQLMETEYTVKEFTAEHAHVLEAVESGEPSTTEAVIRRIWRRPPRGWSATVRPRARGRPDQSSDRSCHRLSRRGAERPAARRAREQSPIFRPLSGPAIAAIEREALSPSAATARTASGRPVSSTASSPRQTGQTLSLWPKPSRTSMIEPQARHLRPR